MSLFTPILESSPSDFFNRTLVSVEWRQWVESVDPLANRTLLAEYGNLCQRVLFEEIGTLNPRLQQEIEIVCARAAQLSLGRASFLVPAVASQWSTALSVIKSVHKPIQPMSSPQNEWSEAATLLCGLYLATKLVKTMIQSWPQGLIILEQAQVLPI